MIEIKKVPERYLNKVLDLWLIDPKISPKVQVYSEINDHHFIALDNETLDCWIEEFHFEQDAIDYLKGVIATPWDI